MKLDKIIPYFTGSLLFVCSILNASNLKVTITNNGTVPVAFVIVRTQANSDYYRLYVGSGSSKLSQDAWEAALANLQKNIDIIVLAPHGDSVTVTNASQDVMEYDRVLWIVPLFDTAIERNLAQLATSVQSGFLGDYPSVRPFEIGSARTVVITGNGKPLNVSTPGKLAAGAKALFKSSKSKSTPPSTAGVGGFSIASILSGDSSVTEEVKQKLVKKSKHSGAATKDPEGWPDKSNKKAPVYRSFTQAADDLKLSPAEISNLKNYKNLGIDGREKLLKSIETNKVKKSPVKSKQYAWKAIEEYARYNDEEYYPGVR